MTLSAPQQRAFSASAPAQESRGKRKTRLVRKANLDKKAQLVREHEQTRPDPVLGYAQGNEDLWNKSLLKQILLRREDVWAGNAQSASGTSSTASAEAVDADTHGYTPKLFNFGLDSETAHQLSDVLPATSALRSTLGDQATSVGSVMFSRFEDATRAEQEKRDTLMRIIDLRNADSKGIEVENTRRIVEAFGRVPGDTASPEVQGEPSPSLRSRVALQSQLTPASSLRSRHFDDAHPVPLGAPHLAPPRHSEPPGAPPHDLKTDARPQVPPQGLGHALRGCPRQDWRRTARRRGRGYHHEGRAADHDPRPVEAYMGLMPRAT